MWLMSDEQLKIMLILKYGDLGTAYWRGQLSNEEYDIIWHRGWYDEDE